MSYAAVCDGEITVGFESAAVVECLGSIPGDTDTPYCTADGHVECGLTPSAANTTCLGSPDTVVT